MSLGILIYTYLSLALTPITASAVDVSISWNYDKFPLKVQLYTPKPDFAKSISNTGNVKSIDQSPADKKIQDSFLKIKADDSMPAVMIIENKTDEDYYFFAVPHEVHPPTASVGHYFECLCVGKVYKVAAKSVWYRIVRVNLAKTFKNVAKFDINHKIIGVAKKDLETKYKDMLYDK